MGQAAIPVDGPSDPVINAVRQCYVIESKLQGQPEEKRPLLEDALTSKQDVLRFYALDAVSIRRGVSREVGVELVSALAGGMVRETDAERRLDSAQLLASCVLSEFSPNEHDDRSIGSSLIAAIQSPTPRDGVR